eukprot:6212575-Pleurochrysis_carterae.AAC.3
MLTPWSDQTPRGGEGGGRADLSRLGERSQAGGDGGSEGGSSAVGGRGCESLSGGEMRVARDDLRRHGRVARVVSPKAGSADRRWSIDECAA